MLHEVLEAEMTEKLQAKPGERTSERLGLRSGYYSPTLITRVGKLELRVPQDRDGRFSTQLLELYQRSEKAPVSALAEMCVQWASTRKVKGITEELYGHSFSASSISEINKTLDKQLAHFASDLSERRRLPTTGPIPRRPRRAAPSHTTWKTLRVSHAPTAPPRENRRGEPQETSKAICRT
jgi:transposase-like protein